MTSTYDKRQVGGNIKDISLLALDAMQKTNRAMQDKVLEEDEGMT